jgi:hypothetical protein
MTRTYIGDGAYAEYDGFGFKLTTEDGIRVTNEIYLEPQVFAMLLRFAKRHIELGDI